MVCAVAIEGLIEASSDFRVLCPLQQQASHIYRTMLILAALHTVCTDSEEAGLCYGVFCPVQNKVPQMSVSCIAGQRQHDTYGISTKKLL